MPDCAAQPEEDGGPSHGSRLIVLGNGNWPTIRNHMSEIAAEIDAARPGKFAVIEMPRPPKPEYQRPEAKPPSVEKRPPFEELFQTRTTIPA